jgi:proteasome lid subunit RPN8/RPN11
MITIELLDEIKAAANASPKKEICGVIYTARRKNIFHQCKNIAEQSQHFIVDPADYAEAEDKGKIIAIVHSHVFENPKPSEADLIGIEKTGLPWLIVNTPVGTHSFTFPSGYIAPYEGRQFVHGVLDCYSIWRDWYKNELGIEMEDYKRDYQWWLKGDDLYEKHYKAAGFVEVSLSELKKHDIILMKVASPVQNHAAVYLGENIILHHVTGKVSSKDVYGGYWRKFTTKVLRHRSMF